MNGFEPVKECIYQYTDAGQWGVQWDEEIVRCRDCKFYLEEHKWCYHFEDSEFCPESNGFCAWGKRR